MASEPFNDQFPTYAEGREHLPSADFSRVRSLESLLSEDMDILAVRFWRGLND